MRTLLLISTALVLAACSDNPQPTAPRNTGSAAADREVISRGGNTNNAKPTDQVGFTKITRVQSVSTTYLPGYTYTLVATCPAGTTVVGGGYRIFGGGVNRPGIDMSDVDEPSHANAWSVLLTDPVTGSTGNAYSVAFCAS